MNEILQNLIKGAAWGAADILPLGGKGIFALGAQGELSLFYPTLGVLLAILILYAKSVWLMLRGFWRMIAGGFNGTFRWRKADRYQMMAVYSLVAAIPTVLLMILARSAGFTADLQGNLLFIGGMMLANGALVYLGSHSLCHHWKITDMKGGHAFKLGLFQAAAGIFPGLSRSAVNLTMARNMGFDRKEALEFSFMMSIPALLTALALSSPEGSVFLAVGALVAAAAMLLLVRWLIQKDRYGILGFLCPLAALGALILNLI